MALLFLLLALALTWGLGALQLWPRTRWVRELPLWLGGALALGAAACVAWGFAGVLRQGDWQALSTDQTVQRLFGPGGAVVPGHGLGATGSLHERLRGARSHADTGGAERRVHAWLRVLGRRGRAPPAGCA